MTRRRWLAQMAEAGLNPTTNQAWLKQQKLGLHGTVTVTDSKTVANGIRATGVYHVPGGFAALFGIKQFTVTATAVAAYGGIFDYALFQGSTTASSLTSNGKLGISNGGGAHSNTGMTLNGPYCVSGGLSLVGSLTSDGGPAAGCSSAVAYTGVLPMPVWTLHDWGRELEG